MLEKIQMIFYDFDGVFTNKHVQLASNCIETLKCSRVDGLGLAGLGKLGFQEVG